MWTDGRWTKTNPKTSPEQSAELKTIFQLVQEIIKTNAKKCDFYSVTRFLSNIYKTNLFTKFHYDWAKNVTSRVFTSFFYYINKRQGTKLSQNQPGGLHHQSNNHHVIQLTGTIFEFNFRIKETNVLTKFHENWAKNKNAPPTGGHFFSSIWTIFELV
ncbi:hypothetical protein DPMN_106149 [Dreissena polymorpha]|uniref:Uncharacterized protein n=1 Tax=Dreissena polymorpha TaxID=45954 RepID=A0A9D4K4G3_DREPO|nr:hypothetical protein DPMN_106149 [Dreissena polymorpha]